MNNSGLAIFVINNSFCYAVRSEIYENRKAYSCNLYDVYVTTNLIENQLFNYYSNKKIEMTICKKIKSNSYTEHIKNIIREYYPPPFWRPESINSMIDSAKANNALWIEEKIYMDFRNRTFTVFNESLWTTDGKHEQVIVNLSPEATFRIDYSYIDMDNNPESAGVANASLDFLESIKDIYFDENKRKEVEKQRSIQKIFDSHWKYMKGNWIKVEENLTSEKNPNIINQVDLYIDRDSLHKVDSNIEGWFKIKILSKMEDFKVDNDYADELAYYARFDLKNNQFFILSCHEKFFNGKIVNTVRTEPEIWKAEKSPYVAGNVLQTIKNLSY